LGARTMDVDVEAGGLGTGEEDTGMVVVLEQEHG
jgi:hypothetical protein